jgi:hypothetical protein
MPRKAPITAREERLLMLVASLLRKLDETEETKYLASELGRATADALMEKRREGIMGCIKSLESFAKHIKGSEDMGFAEVVVEGCTDVLREVLVLNGGADDN